MSRPGRQNRLAAESSPYLRQHAANPVDWYPWGADALDLARRLDRPIFLSIGYSSCHWCHVMAHESFEDDGVAELLNRDFVSIKVDREERPDVDELYMTAVQITTGHGGWPLSAFLLPDGRPFFAGTYFPKEDRHGRPGFLTLLARVASAWRGERDELEETARQIAEALVGASGLSAREKPRPLSAATLDTLVSALSRSFDERHGGFGGAPKFPPHSALAFLLRRAGEGDAEALAMAVQTLEAMALGGIHDHLGGGFHRYATDGHWLVPHFEKMLYDNAQLLAAYAEGFALTGRALFRRTALGIAEYLLREMRGPEGVFYAATDADSEGEEGKFFVWRAAEIAAVLGAEDARFFGERYRVRPEGNWHDEATGRAAGTNILHLASDPSPEEEERLAPLRKKLLEARAERVPPGLDDKRISGWNALALSGLVAAGGALGEPRYLEAAHVLAKFLLTTMRDAEGRLLRTWKDGAGGVPAFLEDEAYLANALLDLAEAEKGELAEQAHRKAREAVDALRRRFRRPGSPGFTFSGEGHERLLAPARDLFDKAIPSGSAAATRALARLARSTTDAALAAEARAALEEVSGVLARSPHGTETWHLALADLLAYESVHGEAVPGPLSAPAAAGPVTVEASAAVSRLAPGEAAEVTVRVGIAHGFHLPESGLAVEAQAGSGLVVESVNVSPPTEAPTEEGSVERRFVGKAEARVVVSAKKPGVAGDWLVVVTVRFRACGEGACEPERALSAAVPLRVG